MPTDVTKLEPDIVFVESTEIDGFSSETPAGDIEWLPGKGAYVTHIWVTKQLNRLFKGMWNWEIIDWRIVPENDPKEVFVLGKLTILSTQIVKQQFGTRQIPSTKMGTPAISVGNALKAASSDALKKAASLLEIGIDISGAIGVKCKDGFFVVTGGNFNQRLSTIQSIPNHRWNGKVRIWEFPAIPSTVIRKKVIEAGLVFREAVLRET